MRTIPLTRGYFTIVDDADYERLSLHRYSWCAFVNRSGIVYAGRGASLSELESGLPSAIMLHRVICGVVSDPARWVDHHNHDGLDNRRENLRVCTASQNTGNQRKTRGRSGYKGVTWNRRKEKWQAAIGVDGKSQHLGYYVSEEAAARTYDWVAYAKWGGFACLNFPLVLDEPVSM